jgi:hypothetical protein
VAVPAFDHDPSFLERGENLAIEPFIAKPGIDGLDSPALPGTAWSDINRIRANGSDPLLDGLRGELRAIIGLNVPGTPHRTKRSESTSMTSTALSYLWMRMAKALMRELVDHVQHPVLSSVMGAILHEVGAPNIVGALS